MARRLTTFSKLLITLVIVGGLVYLGNYLLNQTEWGRSLKSQAEENAANGGTFGDEGSGNRSDDDVLTVQLVTWGGYAPGLYYNNGSEPSEDSRFYKDYGLKVRFVKNDDLQSALNAWIADEYDVLVQTADAFPLYTFPGDLAQYKPQVFMQVDWSRGGDVIIAKRGINSINDLKGKRIAVTEPAPSQTLLISALEAAGLKYTDVTIAAAQDPVVASQMFKAPDVDAAVVWSPFDIEAIREVAGSKVLVTTKEQSNIIADIFFAKESYIRNNRNKINAFYEGWMKAVAELQNDPAKQEVAAEKLATFLDFPKEDAMGAMSVVRWTTHGDNKDFFGLNPQYQGVKGGDLYDKMARTFHELGQAEKVAPPWRNVINTGAVQAADRVLSGPGYESESMPAFSPPTEAEKTKPALANKPVSINFETGKFTLTENAKTIIDLQFAEVARSFASMRIRIEGNTDNVGSRAMNMELSRKRAQSVADYLRTTYNMDKNRFVIVGNGPDKPVAGCEGNQSADCKAKNRRTDFQLIGS
ncbi:MAG: OmpA family protein [Lewinellaceae bacterium]|nr:OmpA family protein [Saprospiraceae bacterium]MCB9311737.1 OmpA family protein [Lewinellaceae bacterium]HRW75305.1 phosphate ABC transporter substrate-binding/OmpA family protein [Saprospiraceae bacterium]